VASTTWWPRPTLLQRKREEARDGERCGELSEEARERDEKHNENRWRVSILYFYVTRRKAQPRMDSAYGFSIGDGLGMLQYHLDLILSFEVLLEIA
jgi:hypothetical protein